MMYSWTGRSTKTTQPDTKTLHTHTHTLALGCTLAIIHPARQEPDSPTWEAWWLRQRMMREYTILNHHRLRALIPVLYPSCVPTRALKGKYNYACVILDLCPPHDTDEDKMGKSAICWVVISMDVSISFPIALPSGYSCVCAVALSVLTFASMQVFREELAAERGSTILGGFIGSLFFMFLLTVSPFTTLASGTLF